MILERTDLKREDIPESAISAGFYVIDQKILHSVVYDYNRIEPPKGDGYQLWETTSEGSPTSPVFATLEALCEWCETNTTTFGSFKASKEEWLQMLSPEGHVHVELTNDVGGKLILM